MTKKPFFLSQQHLLTWTRRHSSHSMKPIRRTAKQNKLAVQKMNPAPMKETWNLELLIFHAMRWWFGVRIRQTCKWLHSRVVSTQQMNRMNRIYYRFCNFVAVTVFGGHPVRSGLGNWQGDLIQQLDNFVWQEQSWQTSEKRTVWWWFAGKFDSFPCLKMHS